MHLPHRLDRTVVIQATPATVFSFFTESDRWASWWGAGSTIEPRTGGRVYIRHANGIESSGEVVEVEPPRRFVFTYGFNSGNPMPPGSSLVTISLEPAGAATRLQLVHDFAEASPRDEHVQGWRYQLSVFANVVTDLANARAADTVDAWFKSWSEKDEDRRRETLAEIAISDVQVRDRFSLLEGIDDLVRHIGATQRFMPDMQPAAPRRSPALPGHASRWLGSHERCGRRTRHGNERLYAAWRRQDRVGDRVLGPAPSVSLLL